MKFTPILLIMLILTWVIPIYFNFNEKGFVFLMIPTFCYILGIIADLDEPLKRRTKQTRVN